LTVAELLLVFLNLVDDVEAEEREAAVRLIHHDNDDDHAAAFYSFSLGACRTCREGKEEGGNSRQGQGCDEDASPLQEYSVRSIASSVP